VVEARILGMVDDMSSWQNDLALVLVVGCFSKLTFHL
jgi:hypothetical protein